MTTLDITKKAQIDWHNADIVCALRKSGYSLRSLSRELGYSPTAAGQALLHPYPKMERAIATKIGVDPSEIWPSRYQSIR